MVKKRASRCFCSHGIKTAFTSGPEAIVFSGTSNLVEGQRYQPFKGLSQISRRTAEKPLCISLACCSLRSEPLEKGRISSTQAQAVNYVKTSMTNLRLYQFGVTDQRSVVLSHFCLLPFHCSRLFPNPRQYSPRKNTRGQHKRRDNYNNGEN